MEPDERDRTGQPFVLWADLLESVVAWIGVLVIYDQLPIRDSVMTIERSAASILYHIAVL
jgi:hypothetical protein